MIGDNALLEPAFYVILCGVIFCYVLFRRARKARPQPVRPQYDVAYECVAERMDKASTDFRDKFPEAREYSTEKDVWLLRFGIFNIGFEAISQSAFRRPLKVAFPQATRILTARFAESLSTHNEIPAPTFDGPALALPPFQIDGGGTIIFNIILRGDATITEIDGDIEHIDEIRRLG